MLSIFRKILIPLLLVGLTAGYLKIGTSSVSYHKCQAQDADYQKDTSYDRSPRVGPIDRVMFFMECEAYFSDKNEGIITAFATVIIGVFTITLWLSHADHVKHIREVERAYVSGGGGPSGVDPSQFLLQMDNYGKTPAILQSYAVIVDDLNHVQSSKPAYLGRGFIRTSLINRVPAGARAHNITSVQIPPVANPVAYGRFWYNDIWGRHHIFSFVLPLRHPTDHTTVANVDAEYTKWT